MPEIGEPTKSYLSVHYELRSAKQVERRMLIDALHILGEDGFRLSEYQYAGMGSIYFVDFVLFHKLLNIRSMWSVEYDTDIRRRVRFNKPFSFVRIVIDDIADVIPRLSTRKRHLLWIDYDLFLSQKVAMDVVLACSRLTAGSILLVTVDVEPPIRDGTPQQWKEYFEEELGQYVPPGASFAKSRLARTNIDIMSSIISSAVAPRDIEFFPLFSFLYRDGHQMLTVGGMFVGPADKERLLKSRILETLYVRQDFRAEPCEIRVPRLTRKERVYLEGAMPCADGWHPRAFELDDAEVRAYKDIYRFFPVYAELFL